jgi:hypothetical protein
MTCIFSGKDIKLRVRKFLRKRSFFSNGFLQSNPNASSPEVFNASLRDAASPTRKTRGRSAEEILFSLTMSSSAAVLLFYHVCLKFDHDRFFFFNSFLLIETFLIFLSIFILGKFFEPVGRRAFVYLRINFGRNNAAFYNLTCKIVTGKRLYLYFK